MEGQQQSKELGSQEKEKLAGEVMESLGEPESAANHENGEAAKDGEHDLPEYAKRRLSQQDRKHKREMYAMQQRLEMLESRTGAGEQGAHTEPPINPYTSGNMSDDERIARAVRYAREQDKLEEQKRQDVEKMAHVNRQYQRLQDNLDRAHDKYEDFHDIVMKDDVPYTPHIRDAVLLLSDDHQADVLYKLGKNRDELARISKLHPLDQAKEVVKLSHGLLGGNNGSQKAQPHRPLGQVKNTPVTSTSVSESTPVSDIRTRMKQGKFK